MFIYLRGSYQELTQFLPSQRRAALVALHIIFPYILSRAYASLRRKLVLRHQTLETSRLQDASFDSLFASNPLPPQPRSGIQKLLDSLASLATSLPTFETLTEDYLRSIHLAVFYLTGRYYNLSKRAAGIRFVGVPFSPKFWLAVKLIKIKILSRFQRKQNETLPLLLPQR